MMVFFEDIFGQYPLDGYGIAFSDSFGGLAMESAGPFAVQPRLRRRLARLSAAGSCPTSSHQYFGSAVSPAWRTSG
jgi:hypothetical protein